MLPFGARHRFEQHVERNRELFHYRKHRIHADGANWLLLTKAGKRGAAGSITSGKEATVQLVADKRAKLQSGLLSYELDGLRAVVEATKT